MSTDQDTVLARLIQGLVTDVLTWLAAYPEEQVDPAALRSMRRSIDWVSARLPADQRIRLASGDPAPATLPTVLGLLVDLVWWLDSCDDADVDPDVAVKALEGCAAALHALPDDRWRRLRDVLDRLVSAERHDGRRYRLRLFPFGMGLVEDEPDVEEPPARGWVRPEERRSGHIIVG